MGAVSGVHPRPAAGGSSGFEKHFFRRDAQGETERAVAIVRETPVVAGAEDHARGGLDGFVARAGDLEVNQVCRFRRISRSSMRREEMNMMWKARRSPSRPSPTARRGKGQFCGSARHTLSARHPRRALKFLNKGTAECKGSARGKSRNSVSVFSSATPAAKSASVWYMSLSLFSPRLMSRVTFLFSAFLLAALTAGAQTSRISGPMDETRRVTLAGHIHPRARVENDQGRVSGRLMP